MQKRRLLGISLMVLGLATIFAKPLGITGAVIGAEAIKDIWFYIVGSLLVVGGLIFSYENIMHQRITEATKRYGEVESKIKSLLGRKYYDINSKERAGYIKSYRRNLDKRELEELESLKISPEEEKYLENDATKFLKRNHIPERTDELIRLGRRCGYDLTEQVNEGTRVRNKLSGAVLTVIPRHKTIKKGTSKGILKRMATGKPKFRKKVA